MWARVQSPTFTPLQIQNQDGRIKFKLDMRGNDRGFKQQLTSVDFVFATNNGEFVRDQFPLTKDYIGEWINISLSLRFNAESKISEWQVIINNEILSSGVATKGDYFVDSAENEHFFLFGYLTSFVWDFFLINRYQTPAQLSSRVQTESLCSSCAACPTSLNGQCLSTCEINAFTSINNTCEPCLAGCKFGCNRGTTCNFCDDPLCSYCKSVAPGECTLCKSNAHFFNGRCKCDLEAYLAQDECVICEEGCSACDAKGLCFDCKDGFFLITGKCLKCYEGCKRCVSNPQCLECNEGFQLDGNGICTACD